jgi:hypothetical protein
MSTINDSRMKLERMLAVVLPAYLPQAEGCAVEVDIIEDGLKMHSGAGSESWRPYNGGEIRIRFNASPAVAPPTAVEERSHFPVEDEFDDRGNAWQNRSDLIRSLQRAGRREGFEFVSLKWFRDLFLPAEQYVWSDSLEARSREIGDAIDDGAILTYKVPNTRSPEFPVTAIRLNLEHPDVMAAVGEAPPRPSGFQPVGIRGQHLSSTILQDRR